MRNGCIVLWPFYKIRGCSCRVFLHANTCCVLLYMILNINSLSWFLMWLKHLLEKLKHYPAIPANPGKCEWEIWNEFKAASFLYCSMCLISMQTHIHTIMVVVVIQKCLLLFQISFHVWKCGTSAICCLHGAHTRWEEIYNQLL